MTAEQNKSIVRRFLTEYSPAVVEELLLPDYVHHDPALPPELQHGREAYKQIAAMFYTAFPDLQVTVEDLLAEGDKVACRWVWRGTHQGEFSGLAPSGKQVVGTAISVHRIVHGKIAESWVNFDALGMMQQLGALPAPEHAGN